MKLGTLKEEDRHLELELQDETHTFANALREILLEDPDVEFVSYVVPHPQIRKSKLVLRTKNHKPQTALKDAVKRLKERTDEFRKIMKKCKPAEEEKKKK